MSSLSPRSTGSNASNSTTSALPSSAATSALSSSGGGGGVVRRSSVPNAPSGDDAAGTSAPRKRTLREGLMRLLPPGLFFELLFLCVALLTHRCGQNSAQSTLASPVNAFMFRRRARFRLTSRPCPVSRCLVSALGVVQCRRPAAVCDSAVGVCAIVARQRRKVHVALFSALSGAHRRLGTLFWRRVAACCIRRC